MAPSTSLCESSICKMGNTSNRPVRLGDSSRSLQLRVSRLERQSSPLSRCFQYSMALSTGLGISTTVPNSQGADAPKPIDGCVSDNCTAMGKGVLACRSQKSSASRPIDTEKSTQTSSQYVYGTSSPTSRENNSRGMEMWGWSKNLKAWNHEQLSLLKTSWRKSTLNTYETAWKRWVAWASSHDVDSSNPTGSQLAQFLSDLYLIHKLSYNTITLYKSVVSTLSNSESSSQLSSHALVKHILKSIAIKNPKSIKSPIWNVSDLISFLTNYSVDINNVFQTMRHTAILLLLCSGRRIHDLTLLRTDPDYCIISNNSIIFWPQFGSKTDCSNYRQSGWKLLNNPNKVNLNPIFWIKRTITLLNERRISAKCLNLFITVRGEAKPASRTVIAGWIKTLFKEAGISATPGSVRSAVASKNWLENCPLDEILARGNWRSANTFKKYYRREVMKVNNSSTVTQLFSPINRN
ncbi:hypothetical protein O3G_MSEX012851 [Manduca sexta]|uniref:Tyr recombinase domain-containing protein n=1 Tax=Manduca sexta TaxID=7130 RepID=A0A921ZPN4_MANSE|nr:hypothetical protein O3G_MSEX012851 [Manduca sexta]